MTDKFTINGRIDIGEGFEVDRWKINTDHLLTKEQEQRFDDKYNSFELCDTVCKQDSDRLKQYLADEIALAIKETLEWVEREIIGLVPEIGDEYEINYFRDQQRELLKQKEL